MAGINISTNNGISRNTTGMNANGVWAPPMADAMGGIKRSVQSDKFLLK